MTILTRKRQSFVFDELLITVPDDEMQLQKEIVKQKKKLNLLDVHMCKLKHNPDENSVMTILQYSAAISFLSRQCVLNIFGVEDLSKEFKLKNERTFVKALIEINSHVIYQLHDKWKSDMEIAHFIMTIDNGYAENIDSTLIRDPIFVKRCVRDCNCPWLYEMLSDQDKQDKELARELVMLDGYVYIHLEEELKVHGDIMYQAVKQNHELWEWIKLRFNSIGEFQEYQRKYNEK